MCERCQDFDFPIADIWRPCYRPSQPSHRRARRYIPGEEDFEARTVVWNLEQKVRLLTRLLQQEQAKNAASSTTDIPTFQSIRVVNE